MVVKNLIIKLLFVSIIYLSSLRSEANPQEIGDIKQININTEQKSTPYFTDIFSIEKYIKLETTSDNLVKYIYSLEIVDDNIYAFSNRKVFVWNTNGSYIGSIGKQGRGPDELVQASDFVVSPDGKEIGIWDNPRSTLFRYQSDGQLIGKTKFDIKYVSNLAWTDSGYFIFNSEYLKQKEQNFTFYVSNTSKSEKLKGFVPYNQKAEGYGFLTYPNFPKFHEKQYVWKSMDNIIYEFKENKGFNPELEIVFEKGQIEYDEFLSFKGDTKGLIDRVNKNRLCYLFAFNEFEDYYSVTYMRGTGMSTNIILKNENKQYRIQHKPQNFDPIGDVVPFFKHDEYLVGVVEPYALKNKLDHMLPLALEKMGDSGKLLKQIASEIKVDDNPIVLFLKIKQK